VGPANATTLQPLEVLQVCAHVGALPRGDDRGAKRFD
jgi:hypothetical protein